MSVELLNATTVIPYLLERRVIASTENLVVEELSGGVSNVVLAVRNNDIDVVLKQALAELKVATKWAADQRRAIVEARAVQLYNSISPNRVPRLVDSDDEMFTLVIERAPHSCRVWKSELLAGRINPAIGEDLGKTLATWHIFGESSVEIAHQFAEDSLFEQLRIDPFYREIKLKNPDLSAKLDSMIVELKEIKLTIVHGDFSPKNFLVDEGSDVYILDFEVAHLGNPVFDQAFVLAHLLCKFFRTRVPNEEIALTETATAFLDGYGAMKSGDINPSLSAHIAAIALARVEGKSRVDYLDGDSQEEVKKCTKSALAATVDIHPLELFSKAF